MNFKKIREWLTLDNIKAKTKEQCNLDNGLDISTDLLLVVFLDALATPILIPIRIGKLFLKKMVKASVMYGRQWWKEKKASPQ